jgi:hypothetical protein
MFVICLVYYKTCSETKSLKIKWLGLADFVPSDIKLMDSELRCCLPCSAHHIKSFLISASYTSICLVSQSWSCWCVTQVHLSITLLQKINSKGNVSDGRSCGFGASLPVQRPANFGYRNSQAADFHCCGAPPICRKTKGCISSIFDKRNNF